MERFQPSTLTTRGQDRGYYIHTVEDGGQVKSEFFKLPTRQYKTIRLENEDVEKINDGEYDSLPIENYDVQDKVVRVLLQLHGRE